MQDGMIVHNCLHVAPNGNGAEVLCILLRQPGMDDVTSRPCRRGWRTIKNNV